MKCKVSVPFLFITILNLLLFNQIALAKDKEIHYLRDRISFSIAEGWKMTANDSIGANAYYFSAERQGPLATGLITVTWVNKVEDPGKMIEINQKSMKAANIYRNPGIEFSAVENDSFAGYKVKRSRYVTFVKEQKIEGTILCFNSSEKTISIFIQTGTEDKKPNQKAFDLLQRTFNCRE